LICQRVVEILSRELGVSRLEITKKVRVLNFLQVQKLLKVRKGVNL